MEGRKGNVLFTDAVNIFLLTVKEHSDNEGGNPLSPLHGLLFSISSKYLLHAPSNIQDSTYRGL